MKSVIVGTAGHIDHGKTALVRALTGIDTDRLEEEKRRGITIELGFAHLELPGPNGPVRLGFVDVPGHERFVRNMLAGVGGIDLLLFVISAEEGIKPQTREHFDICRLLQVHRGITVLTKCDLVDADTLEVVRMEVEEFLRGSFLDASRSPMVAVSAMTGTGLDELKRELARVSSEVQAKDIHAPFRLPIDRVFTMKGFGTVITGTTIAGEVHKEQEVEVLPAMRRARVRGVQVHGETSERAAAGQRTALNLAGVPQEGLERGMMLAQTGLLLPTTRLDVKLTLLQSTRPLKDRSQVHLHLFTTETIAEVVLYEGKEVRPGSDAWAQLRMETAIAAAPGDRFILRQFSPVTTIGGGVIVDVSPTKRVKPDVRVATLEKLALGDDIAKLRVLVERREERGLRATHAVHETGWSNQRLQSVVQEIQKSGAITRFADLLIASATLEVVKRKLLSMVEAFHKSNPLVAGIGKQELLEKSGFEEEVFAGALAAMIEAKKLALTAEQVHLPGRGVVMKDDEAKSQQEIEAAFASAGLKVPALKEVLAGLKIDRVRAQKIVTLLLRDKVLVKVSEDLVFHAKALAALKQQITGLKSTSPKIDVSRFKDVTGVSRKYAIPLLEYLDREHVTRRDGDQRTIL